MSRMASVRCCIGDISHLTVYDIRKVAGVCRTADGGDILLHFAVNKVIQLDSERIDRRFVIAEFRGAVDDILPHRFLTFKIGAAQLCHIAQGQALFFIDELTDGGKRVDDIDDTREIRIVEVITDTADGSILAACDTVIQKRARKRRRGIAAAHFGQPQNTADVRGNDLGNDGLEQVKELFPCIKVIQRKVHIMRQIRILLDTAPARTDVMIEDSDGIGLFLFVKHIFKCLAEVDIRRCDEDICGGDRRDLDAGGVDIVARILLGHTCIPQTALNDTVVEDGRTGVPLCDDLHAQLQKIVGHILGIADRHRRIDQTRCADGFNAHIGQLIPDRISVPIHAADHQRCGP